MQPDLIIPYASPINKPFIKSGGLNKNVRNWYTTDVERRMVAGPFSRIEFRDLELTRRARLAAQLIRLGWEPEYFTEKGSPKLTISGEPVPSLSRISGSIGTNLSEWYTLNHRRGQIKGWLENVRQDGRLSAGAFSNGTNTARMRHTLVVNVPKAADYVLFGKQMRELFTVPKGYSMVGGDASGLELRMLCHYMDDPDYTEVLLNGDIHTRNQEMAGLPTRDDAKTFIYAFLYGAGNVKIGSIVGGNAKDGRELREGFLARLPRLSRLINKVEEVVERRPYLVGLDGRYIRMRKDPNGHVQKHKALNTLLQSAGAIVMKQSLVNLYPLDMVINMHDEMQLEVPEGKEVDRGEELKRSIIKAGEDLNLRIPLDAEYKIGKNWAETH